VPLVTCALVAGLSATRYSKVAVPPGLIIWTPPGSETLR
jgi:hypothetical protein